VKLNNICNMGLIDFSFENKICVDFINRYTTIDCVVDSDIDGTFWNGILVERNRIIVDLSMAHPGDLLHEAGHLATMPQSSRLEVFHDLDEMPNLMQLVLETGKPYGDDDGSTGWAYAACLKLKLPTELPFAHGYNNNEELHLICKSPLSRFGYPLKKLKLLKTYTLDWCMLGWDINLID
jgi:hypothetical protein